MGRVVRWRKGCWRGRRCLEIVAIGAWPNGRGGDCKEYSESTIGYGPGVRVEIEEITRVSGQAHRAPLYIGLFGYRNLLQQWKKRCKESAKRRSKLGWKSESRKPKKDRSGKG